jgi:hypothetical protein
MVKPIDTSTAGQQWYTSGREIYKQDIDDKFGYGKQDITIQNLDNHIDINKSNDFIIISSKSFGTRLWYVISNPLCYLFNGYIRY